MITTYLSLYLVFIIAVTLVISLIVLKLRLPSPRLIITLLLLFILSPLVVGYFYLMYFNSLPETIVPKVKGLALDAARARLEGADLRVRVAGEFPDVKYPAGVVVSQRPEEGRRVKVGRVVNLVISSGSRKVKVPNLLGRPLSQSEAVLSATELKLGEVKFEKNTEVEEGTILAQEPLPEEEVSAGSRIDLLVATSQEVIMTKEAE